MELHAVDARAGARVGVQLGLVAVGVLGGAQRGLGAVLGALAHQLVVAPGGTATPHRTAQRGVAGVDVVVLELGDLVVGVDAGNGHGVVSVKR
ncbi:hypothetical protein D9M70_634030 [compost metagenome]